MAERRARDGLTPDAGEKLGLLEELLQNLYEAIEGCLSVDVDTPEPGGTQRIMEIAV